MEDQFVCAEELKKEFDVSGHFYVLDIKNRNPIRCRSVLEIKSKAAVANAMADAVFVMMNPGSSAPLIDQERRFTAERMSDLVEELVPTKPDITQYQVMRVMRHLQWEYVRVINLSDICDPRSKSFVATYKALEKELAGDGHSVFSSHRGHQLARHLSRKPGSPIVCAWGVHNELSSLISHARKALRVEKKIMGVAKHSEEWRYYHPLPMPQHKRSIWIRQLLAVIRSDNAFNNSSRRDAT